MNIEKRKFVHQSHSFLFLFFGEIPMQIFFFFCERTNSEYNVNIEKKKSRSLVSPFCFAILWGFFNAVIFFSLVEERAVRTMGTSKKERSFTGHTVFFFSSFQFWRASVSFLIHTFSLFFIFHLVCRSTIFPLRLNPSPSGNKRRRPNK